jgi:hypothetical protein
MAAAQRRALADDVHEHLSMDPCRPLGQVAERARAHPVDAPPSAVRREKKK